MLNVYCLCLSMNNFHFILTNGIYPCMGVCTWKLLIISAFVHIFLVWELCIGSGNCLRSPTFIHRLRTKPYRRLSTAIHQPGFIVWCDWIAGKVTKPSLLLQLIVMSIPLHCSVHIRRTESNCFIYIHAYIYICVCVIYWFSHCHAYD